MTLDLGSNITVEEEKDVLGGGVLPSGVYDCIIKLAYLDKSAGGAISINFVFGTFNRADFKKTIYISSKTGSFTYKNKKTGEDTPLPGYSQVNSICQLSVGKQLKDIGQEEKMISIYNYELRKEAPTKVLVLTDLLNASVTLGILEVIEDKKSKNAVGEYVATGETRTLNDIAKVFRTEGHLTTAEITAKITEGEFVKKWLDKNKGSVKDKSTKSVATGTVASLTGGSPSTSTDAPQTKSLFG